MAPKKKSSFTSPSEIILWLLFVALIFPAAFAGYAVGHYTSLGKPPKTVIETTTVGSTSMSTSTPATTTAATTTSSSGGDVAAGKDVFNGSAGCAGCHTFAAAGSGGTIGPDLDKQLVTDAEADNHMSLAVFVKESIVHPEAYIAKGYTGGIMPGNFGETLTPTQINDLVAFIVSGTN